jgi:hypothetical protein
MTQTQSRWPNRDAVLVALYRISNASTLVMASVEEIAIAANIAVDEAMPALEYLKDRDLVAFRAMGPMVALTPRGVDRAEDVMYPNVDTEGLTLVLTIDERGELEKTIQDIKKALETDKTLDRDTRASVDADLASLSAQLLSPKPSRQVVRVILHHLVALAENVAANVISAKLLGL